MLNDGQATTAASYAPPPSRSRRTPPRSANDDTRGDRRHRATVTGNAITGTGADTDAQDPSAALVVSALRTGTELAGAGTAGTVGNALVGTYGALTLNFDGTYTYQVDNNNAGRAGTAGSLQTLDDIFTYTVRDTAGLTDLAQIRITITGANDPRSPIADAISATEAGGLANGTAGVNPSAAATGPASATTPIPTLDTLKVVQAPQPARRPGRSTPASTPR